jgi:phage/plasmid primase-like uncharacterized protein
MTQFIDFCRSFGLKVDSVVLGAWKRVPTTDKPRSDNGAYFYMGTHGFAQNHATMTEPARWTVNEQDTGTRIDPAVAEAAAHRESQRIAEGRAKAAQRAQTIVAQARLGTHPYLEAKGFKELEGLVWMRDDAPVLVVPMRAAGKLVGCQLIEADGEKKFLPGQSTKGAVFTLGQGTPIYCEGYATGLSAHAALLSSRLPGSVVVCFSAHNLKSMATTGLVLADNDASQTGELAARATGLPFWMSPVVGEDFNDFAQRVGAFQASAELKGVLMRAKRAARAAEPIP